MAPVLVSRAVDMVPIVWATHATSSSTAVSSPAADPEWGLDPDAIISIGVALGILLLIIILAFRRRIWAGLTAAPKLLGKALGDVVCACIYSCRPSVQAERRLHFIHQQVAEMMAESRETTWSSGSNTSTASDTDPPPAYSAPYRPVPVPEVPEYPPPAYSTNRSA